MICPTCGTHIPDGLVRCPACHASVGMTIAMPTLQGRWCPSCGAGVGWEDEVCPHCGLPLTSEWGAPIAQNEAPVEERQAEVAEDSLEAMEDESAQTKAIPRIESAIPPEDSSESRVAAHEAMPGVGRIVFAGILAIAMVCGLVVYITQPWAPPADSIRATEEADTTMAGFPGTVESLSGQDNAGTTVVALSGDDATYAELMELYEKLGRYEARADASEALFAQVGFGPDKDARINAKRECEALAIDVSNVMANLGQIDVSSGTYVAERDNLTTLGSWLRNRVDALKAAWVASSESNDPAADEQALRALLLVDHDENGFSVYRGLFEQNYGAWQPQKKEASQ